MNDRPFLALVGGFLGAGKTSLILAAARELQRRGMRSAAIMNDQGESLVDTRLAQEQGMEAGEVTGGCFCCRLSELVRVADQLRDYAPDVIFAEPVGSCTDLSATILQPLRYSNFQLTPLTVLMDPARWQSILSDPDPNLKFLLKKQLEEADLVCYTKSDLYPGESPRRVSARTGQGVAAWLDEILSSRLSAGSRVLDIDYGEYARAEAALAWLNFEARLELEVPLSPAMVLGPLLDRIAEDLIAADIALVHLKAIDDSPAGFVKAAICANGEEPQAEGDLYASPAAVHQIRLNLRAAASPEPVRAIVEAALSGISANQNKGRFSGWRLDCFSPAPPNPEQRIAQIRT